MSKRAQIEENGPLSAYQAAVLDELNKRDRCEVLTDWGQRAAAAQVRVAAQGHLYKVRVCRQDAGRTGGGIRGLVEGFSRGSRKRLLELMSRLDFQYLPGGLCVYVTVTYPADYPSDRYAKRHHMRAFFERVRRRWRSSAAGIWRMEHQGRGAPHFHILLWGVPPIAVELLRSWWAGIIGYLGPYELQVDSQVLTDWRQVMSYVGKYVAKVVAEISSPAATEVVEDCVSFEQVMITPPGVLDIVTYWHAGESSSEAPACEEQVGSTRSDTIGRVWGVFQRDLLPWGKVEYMQLEVGRWLAKVKRMADGVLKGLYRARVVIARRRGRKPGPCFKVAKGLRCGFSLFSEDPYRFFDAALGVYCPDGAS